MDVVLKFAAFETEDNRWVPAIIVETGLTQPPVTFGCDMSLPDRGQVNSYFKMFIEAVKSAEMYDFGDGVPSNTNERGLHPATPQKDIPVTDTTKKKKEDLN